MNIVNGIKQTKFSKFMDVYLEMALEGNVLGIEAGENQEVYIVSKKFFHNAIENSNDPEMLEFKFSIFYT